MNHPSCLPLEVATLHGMSLEDLDMRTPDILPGSPFLAEDHELPALESSFSPSMLVGSPRHRLLLSELPHRQADVSKSRESWDTNIDLDERGTNTGDISMAGGKVDFKMAESNQWRENKEKVEELYMTRNLNLKEVISIMKQQYGFHATARMYKRRFEEWGWFKYNAKRRQQAIAAGKAVPRRGGKACTRRIRSRYSSSQYILQSQRDLCQLQPAQVAPLMHVNKTAKILYSAVSWTHRYLAGFTDENSQTEMDHPTRLDGERSISMGLRHFRAGDNVTGGRVVRQACILLERAAIEDPLSFLLGCLSIVDELLGFDELILGQSVFAFLVQYAESTPAIQFLAPIIGCLLQALNLGYEDAECIILRVLRLFIMTFRGSRGIDDDVTLWLLDLGSNLLCADAGFISDKELRETCMACRTLVENANSTYRKLDATNTLLRFEFLRTELTDAFRARHEALLESLFEYLQDPRFSEEAFATDARGPLSDCYWRLFWYYDDIENYEKMVEIAVDYVARAKSYLPEIIWIENLLRMKHFFFLNGMEKEADLLQKKIMLSEGVRYLEVEFAEQEADFLASWVSDW